MTSCIIATSMNHIFRDNMPFSHGKAKSDWVDPSYLRPGDPSYLHRQRPLDPSYLRIGASSPLTSATAGRSVIFTSRLRRRPAPRPRRGHPLRAVGRALQPARVGTRPQPRHQPTQMRRKWRRPACRTSMRHCPATWSLRTKLRPAR